MNFIKNFTTIVIFCLIYKCGRLSECKQATCYVPSFLNISWNDTPSTYRVNISSDNKGNVHSLTWVYREIAKPIVNFMTILRETTTNNRDTTLYNVTAPSCNIQMIFNKVPVIRQAFQALTKKTNFTFACPLMPGTYYMQNLDFGPQNSILAFLYRPNVQYVFKGGVYEQAKNKPRTTLVTFNILVKIMKKTCK